MSVTIGESVTGPTRAFRAAYTLRNKRFKLVLVPYPSSSTDTASTEERDILSGSSVTLAGSDNESRYLRASACSTITVKSFGTYICCNK
jgi:hypothetical protein